MDIEGFMDKVLAFGQTDWGLFAGITLIFILVVALARSG
jgi:hypothetical protein